MLDLIYIVEDQFGSGRTPKEDASYSPNFTMAGKDESLKVTSGVASALAAGVAVGSFSGLLLPTSLIASAVLGTPSLISLLTKERATKSEDSAPDLAKLEEAYLLSAYIQHHSLSRSQAKAAGYRFQPGHPVVGKAYRKHPLTDFPNPDNGNLYIPSDSYDSILLEERESELIKLLVHLGATKITITKKASDKSRSSAKVGVSAQAGPMGGGEVNYSGSSELDTATLDTREFSLTGRPWKIDSKIERDSFFWLSYEPSWKAVVFARENGGCLAASLEIKESTSFSTDKNLELSVKAKLTEVGAHAGTASSGVEDKTYFVKVEFSPIQQNA